MKNLFKVLIFPFFIMFWYLFIPSTHSFFVHADDNLAQTSSRVKLKESEALFNKKPTVYQGAIIVNICYFLEDYDKAIHYGEWCLRLDANKTSYGHLINLWLAASYLKKGNADEAKRYLSTALALDKTDVLKKTNAINEFELQDIFESIIK